jgi:hypothetical protein
MGASKIMGPRQVSGDLLLDPARDSSGLERIVGDRRHE